MSAARRSPRIPRGSGGRPPAPAHSARRGFTLIEVLVAIVLISVVMLSAARLLVEQVEQVGTSEARAQAAALAEEELERLKLLAPDSVLPQPPTPVDGSPGYLRSVAVRDVGGGPTDVYAYRVVTVAVEPPSSRVPAARFSTAIARW